MVCANPQWTPLSVNTATADPSRPSQLQTPLPLNRAPSLHSTTLADTISSRQAQTPQQRLANERFAKSEASKRGKPQATIKKQEAHKSPISKGWIGTWTPRTRAQLQTAYAGNIHRQTPLAQKTLTDSVFIFLAVLAFVLCGGLIFELLRLFF